MKKFLVICLLFACWSIEAQPRKASNLVIVTLDGMRWQEVFQGVDTAILNDKRFTLDSEELVKQFWSNNPQSRREKLFPFLWTMVVQNGQLYGDRNAGSRVDNANPYKSSYPGYSEIFTGLVDSNIKSDKRIANPNSNVLEFINEQQGYQGKVAIFSTWNIFPYIFNVQRSKLFVNADRDSLPFPSQAFRMINELQFLSAEPLGERLDIATYLAAKQYLEEFHPKVLYIAFDETDDYAHNGMYDQYLKSAHAEDGMIADLWKTLQSLPEYEGRTSLIVTCDHGRGDKIKEQWRDHGPNVEDAGHAWIAAMGPDIRPRGQELPAATLYQKQLAPTLAALLGFHFTPDRGNADPISTIIKF